MKTLYQTLHAFVMGSLIAGLFGFGCALWVIAAGQGSAAASDGAAQIVVLSLIGFALAIFFSLWGALIKSESNQ